LPPDADCIFEALGDASRRRIVDRLARGPASVSALATLLNVTPTAIGQHLHVLERCGLVSSEKVGRVRTCRLDDMGLTVARDWLDQRRSQWDRRLDRLVEIVSREK
jgi:DNA-binding transcriptional ArsR family regulator